MNDFEETLHAILSDPAELERIGRLASELMGGGAAPEASGGEDGELLRRLGGLLHSAGGDDKTGLLNALSPYLRPERAARLRRALRVAGMLRIAGAALREEET